MSMDFNNDFNVNFSDYITERECKLLESNSMKRFFPKEIANLSENDLNPAFYPERIDLRNLTVFPIDCDTTKDRDDAVSITFDGAVYLVGVHIADVAAVVPPFSPIDNEAMSRGTSIYFPGMTIPMLPAVLSNSLCSLCCEDRLTVSTLMEIDSNGTLLDYRIVKSLIHPVKVCTYSEVNQVLDGTASDELIEEYSEILDSLVLLQKLANILRRNRRRNGAEIDSDEKPAEICITEGGVDLVPAISGPAEMIVEELMIQANSCVANYFHKNDLPALFRTHEDGNQAKYKTVCSRHSALSLDCYAHTTSPIRRLADLRMQQVLSAHLLGCSSESIHYLFDSLMEASAVRATQCLNRAKEFERCINRLCYINYFTKNCSELYTGTVCGYGNDCSMRIKIDKLNITVLAFHILYAVGEHLSLHIEPDIEHSSLVAYDIKTA